MLHDTLIELDEVELEFAPGCLARGRGTLNLVTPWGPTLTFKGTFDEGMFAAVRAFAPESNVAPGTVRPTPRHGFRGRGSGLHVVGEGVVPMRASSLTSARPMPVTGDYVPMECTVTSSAPRPGQDDLVVDVHHLGRGLDGVLFSTDPSLPVPGGRGAALEWGNHRFVLRAPDQALQDHVGWSRTGTFTCRGPIPVVDGAWWDLIWPFVLALGSAAGSPIHPIGWVERSATGREWYTSTWRRPTTASAEPTASSPVGRREPDLAPQDHVAWVRALLDTWTQHEPRLGLEVALLYLQYAHGQPEPEIRCRDLVNALERLLGGYCRLNGRKPSSQLDKKLAVLQEHAAYEVFTKGERGEVADLKDFRNRLAHDGGLADLPDQLPEQDLSDAQGWLTTCCYRVLAAIMKVDVPLTDLAARGHPRRRPSEGGFTRSPFVPEPSWPNG